MKITSEKTLDTPDDIAAFLRSDYEDMTARAAFQPGDVVSIANRAGMIPDIGIGDVAVVVYSEPSPSPFTHARLLHENGSTMTMQIQTANLTRRAAA
ncbi:hypothetical protein [Methylobacterium sp. J-068]|uniref:hypothetical protein n=1 Tax=Methylobacterium sp. J-068 TaxID=2836649 RepID=UPI001FB863CA|nr:hypothetical protein [Methylobacterium sp. J-068]MCJ2032886.1 hypothetical protein [Methylobacterium sp. J-068]